jgi:hypothetical protein
MIWNYDDSWRDRFETCEHRDILIVPHGTDVYEVPGGPPRVTSKIPKLNENDEPIVGEYMPVEFVITNEDIYKEKFEYTNSLDTNEDLAFCGCESAMVKFTIRNNKTFDEDQGRYVLDIPNLQNYIITDENGTTLVGECQTHYIIKVYMYFDGDSSSLAYLGMFVVEEDKVSADGYTRDITAFDFLYTIRDMDIYYWYKHLFRGVSYKTNDFKDYFENRKIKVPEDYKPEPAWKEGWVRPARECWTIGEMLTDLIDNILTRYPSEKTVTNREKGTENNTLDDTSNVKQIDNHYTNDLEPYTGLALPMILDEDLFDPNAIYDIPTEPASNAHECYGYMDILNLKVYEDPKIMDAGALSAGKFLEDIGALAGRYPYIRLDTIRNDSYHDLHAYDENNPNTYYPYNLYEKCILTFKPLPDNDSKIHVQNYFDNSEIVKGFKHDLYASGTVHIWELYTRFDDSDSPTFSYANLTKAQNKIKETTPSLLKKLQTSNNMFIDYLAVKKDDVKLAKDPPTPAPSVDDLLVKYTKVRNVLMYGEEVVEPVTKNQKNGLLHQGYAAIKYRTYTPYELTTFADPVREVGDRIKVNFEDKVTGEVYNFDTYILSRKISGIQKMMDTYVAKGNVSQQTFSNYKTGTTYSPQSMGYYGSGTSVSNASSSAGGTTFTGLTKDDFCEIIRNIGFRLLDEPESVSAIFVATSTSESNDDVQVYSNSGSSLEPEESSIHNGDTTNPITIYDNGIDPPELKTITVNAGDYYYLPRTGDGVEYSSSLDYPYYVWTGSKWVYAGTSPDNSGGANEYWCGSGMYIEEFENGEITENSSCNSLTLKLDPESVYQGFSKSQVNNTQFYIYGHTTGSETSLTVTPKYGDVITTRQNDYAWYYQYPGFWTENYYPNTNPITINVPPHVELKWSDPNNINSWEPKPCAWEGTVIIRKRNAAPLHRWDGELIVDSTTKDAYKDTAFIDDTIQLNRTYYYGFFPYYTAYTEDGHAIKYYRFTKTVRVSTGVALDAPEILSIERIS